MSETMTYYGVLTVETCRTCGMVFAMPTDLMEQRLEDHKAFYCPSGHNLHYPGESNVERLRRQLASAKGNADYYREEAEAKARKLAAAKGRITKLKNRTAAGLCPCCNRHFTDLERHMKGQHPEFEEGQR